MAKTTFICPYCFAKNPLSSVQFRCSSKRCVEVDDIEMTIYEHGDLYTPREKCVQSPCLRPLSQVSECDL